MSLQDMIEATIARHRSATAARASWILEAARRVGAKGDMRREGESIADYAIRIANADTSLEHVRKYFEGPLFPAPLSRPRASSDPAQSRDDTPFSTAPPPPLRVQELPPARKARGDTRCYFCGNRAEVYVNRDVPSCGRHGL